MQVNLRHRCSLAKCSHNCSAHCQNHSEIRGFSRPGASRLDADGACEGCASRVSRRGRITHTSAPPSGRLDRKSTRLNSSHVAISYAVFWLEKKRLQSETG